MSGLEWGKILKEYPSPAEVIAESSASGEMLPAL
jgi:hypothetical protein